MSFRKLTKSTFRILQKGRRKVEQDFLFVCVVVGRIFALVFLGCHSDGTEFIPAYLFERVRRIISHVAATKVYLKILSCWVQFQNFFGARLQELTGTAVQLSTGMYRT